MIEFARPVWLLISPLVVGLAVWSVYRRRPAWRYADVRLLAGLPTGRRAAWLRPLAALGYSLGLLGLVIALAGPRRPDLQTRIPAEGIAIVICLDISGSMATKDFPGPSPQTPISRLEAAQLAISRFVDGDPELGFPGRPRDQIGIVTFAAHPTTECPLTLDHSALGKVLTSLTPRTGVDAGTNIGDALAEGVIRLSAAGHRRKVLILMSDGEHNVAGSATDPALKPRQAAQLATNLGIPIYAIDCGGAPDANTPPEQAAQRLDGRKVLAAIAEMTDGMTFEANSLTELRTVYQTIDALERDPVESFRYRRYHDYDGIVALGALVGLAGTLALRRTLLRVGPPSDSLRL